MTSTEAQLVVAPLHKKVALVTGGSRGIGAAIAIDLAKKGASVVIGFLNSSEKATEVVNQIICSGGRAISVQADVTKLSEIEKLFNRAIEAFGTVHIVINNAGVFEPQLVSDLTETTYDKLFATNTKGPFFVAKHAAQILPEGGRIINISTTMTSAPGMIGSAVFAATKAALEVLTRTLARELGPRNITANTVSPGYTKTDSTVARISTEEARAASVFQRWGEPEDIAPIVSFLASDDARWLTGQNIYACGGQVMSL